MHDHLINLNGFLIHDRLHSCLQLVTLNADLEHRPWILTLNKCWPCFDLVFHLHLGRNQQEEDLCENHPYFDTPLFAVGRNSRFRKVCKIIVNAQYEYVTKDIVTGQEIKSKYKQLQWVIISTL